MDLVERAKMAYRTKIQAEHAKETKLVIERVEEILDVEAVPDEGGQAHVGDLRFRSGRSWGQRTMDIEVSRDGWDRWYPINSLDGLVSLGKVLSESPPRTKSTSEE